MLFIPNLSSSRAEKFDTAIALTERQYPDIVTDKPSWTAWAANQQTKWHFISGVEGVNNHLRVNSENPPYTLHALIADYDSAACPEEWPDIAEALDAAIGTGYQPTYIAKTFTPRHLRLIWQLDEPLALPHVDVVKKFLMIAGRKLKVSKIMAGLDDAAWNDPFKYYEVGARAWKQVAGSPRLSHSILTDWMIDAGAKANWIKLYRQDAIPISVIADKVQEMFPNRWRGEFTLGARGTIFWEEGYDNHTAAIVREAGMQTFSRKPFCTWAEIFGKKFVEEYQSRVIGEIAERVVFDGKTYYHKVSDKLWLDLNRENLANALRCLGVNGAAPKGGASEIDRVINHVNLHSRITGAAPMPNQPEFVQYNRGRYLNVSTSRAMKAAEAAPRVQYSFGQGFEFLADYFTKDGGWLVDEEQHHRAMYYAKIAWQDAVEEPVGEQLKSSMGQVLFLVGPVHTGKTLFAQRVLGPALGGWVDASSFLSAEEDFNSHMFEAPLWVVDDAMASTDAKSHRRYSSMIKKVAAATDLACHAKWGKKLLLPWLGRAVVCANDDPVSIRALPALDGAGLDKIIVLRVAARKFKFPKTNKETETRIAEELPNFLRWLNQYEPPAGIEEHNRYRMKAFFDPGLHNIAAQNSEVSPFEDLLETFFESYFNANPGQTMWQGSPTKLQMELASDELLKDIARTYQPIKFADLLKRLENQGTMRYPILYRAKVPYARYTVFKSLAARAAFTDTYSEDHPMAKLKAK